jgi:phosphoribosylformylglycinamidine cyclo-ligase
MTNAYTKAGVNVEAGYELVNRIKKHAKKTERLGVMGSLGGFGGCFDLSQYELSEPVLVSGTDGVGTKLLLAMQMDKHDTIGIDCVAMCVNDIVAQGAQPLYFLDYLATGKNDPERLEAVVRGIADGCLLAGAALIGGETAEMPGMYQPDEYDVAGFAVGIAEKKQLITGEKIQAGDYLVGLSASGVHSNGFSLVRKIFFEDHPFSYEEQLPELGSKSLGEVLLEPTRIYAKTLAPLIQKKLVNGMAHITGGGFVENIPRMLPEQLSAEIQMGTWPILPIFQALIKYGCLAEKEGFEIFNMGIGMVLAVAPEKLQQVQQLLAEEGETAYIIGQVTKKKTDAIVFTEATE